MITPYQYNTSDSKFIHRFCTDEHIGVIYTHTYGITDRERCEIRFSLISGGY